MLIVKDDKIYDVVCKKHGKKVGTWNDEKPPADIIAPLWCSFSSACPECLGTGLVDDNEHYAKLWGKVLTDPFYAHQGKRYCRACWKREI
jgi:hypothetical protein